jgi:hypothetical protein
MSNTGGPAFPMNWVKQEAPNLNVILEQRGMTLRDYFAAKAMQGMFASGNLPKSVQDDELASVAYQVADAMLKAREA